MLLSMMTRFTEADVVVVGLIGERGREVGDFVKNVFSSETRARTVVVAEPADRSPLLRIRAANRATAIAEYFRDKGKNVLLIMDSLTRVAHARREIGLFDPTLPRTSAHSPFRIPLAEAPDSVCSCIGRLAVLAVLRVRCCFFVVALIA